MKTTFLRTKTNRHLLINTEACMLSSNKQTKQIKELLIHTDDYTMYHTNMLMKTGNKLRGHFFTEFRLKMNCWQKKRHPLQWKIWNLFKQECFCAEWLLHVKFIEPFQIAPTEMQLACVCVRTHTTKTCNKMSKDTKFQKSWNRSFDLRIVGWSKKSLLARVIRVQSSITGHNVIFHGPFKP